ncbi:MAG: FAD-dependent oxidoreductase, partial [Candidatus Competibacteraceae bacterium]|nr:FAD-dependent oxidoreductase [Candidatus Competibacteraceae bacterium]
MSKRVVIVGAGPGGLAASLLLARAGLQVTVLERQSRVGGRTSAIEAEGFRFDRGPTFFLYPRVLEEIFAATGHNLHDHVDLIRLDPQYRLIFGGGGRIDATPDIPRLMEEIAAISPHDAQALPRFLDDNRHKLAAFQSVLESPFSSWRDTINPQLLAKLPLIKPWLSLDRDLGRYFKDPRVRLAFSFQSKYLGMSPYRCPSLFSI